MARIFLKAYVAINIVVIVINLVLNILNDTVVHLLGRDDWLIFMIACGALAITEVLEESK